MLFVKTDGTKLSKNYCFSETYTYPNEYNSWMIIVKSCYWSRVNASNMMDKYNNLW